MKLEVVLSPFTILTSLFVYGTLKRGQSNYERFCQGALSIETATIGGRLYELPYGFPALVVPDVEIRATGTTNYLTDAGKQHFLYPAAGAPPSGWDTVYGELMTLRNASPPSMCWRATYPARRVFMRRVFMSGCPSRLRLPRSSSRGFTGSRGPMACTCQVGPGPPPRGLATT